MINISSDKPSCTDKRRVWRQTWMIMRLTALFIIISTLTISAKSYSQKVTLFLQNVPVETVFKQISDQTGYSFLWTKQTINGLPPVSIAVRGANLKDAVEVCLKGLPLTYGIRGNVVYIKRRLIPPLKIPTRVKPPALPLKEVKGIVTDSATGDPLAGVTIKVKGNTTGTVTDVNGRFSLEVPDDAVLVVSYLGYVTKEIPVSRRTSFNISLAATATGLNQLVVVGYGTEKKSNLIGSVSQVNAKDINDRAVPQLSQALAGQMPGVTVIQRSGQPGASGGTIQIRGVGSFGASTAPLILVDGIPVNSLDNINPNDVKSISILKDASAAAIYGARAANGVILVTTKSGSKDHELHLSYNGYVGTQKATAYPKFVNSWQYAMLQNEANPGSWTDEQIQKFKDGSDPDNYPNISYIDLVFKRATLQTGHNISLSNSTDKTDYRLSFGYLYQNGIVIKNDYNRYNIRMNMTNRISPKLKLTSHLSGEQHNNHEPAPPATLDFDNMIAGISQVIRVPAIYPNKLSNGDWGSGTIGKGTPVSYFDNASFYTYKGTHLLVNERLDYTIINNLIVSLLGGYTQLNENSQRFLANQRINANVTLGPGNLTQSSSSSSYKTLQELIQYRKIFQKHNISILLGHSFEASHTGSSSAYRSGFSSNDLTQLNAGDVSTQTNTGTAYEWALDSYFGRIQYNYADKYLVEGDIRYDGSSRFPTDKKYATFPAVAVGWRISEEPFIKNNIEWLDELKLKASYGVLGNQDLLNSSGNIINYPYQQIFNPDYNYPLGSGISTGVAVTTLTDSLLHWESTRTKDIGIEATILKGKVSFSATYFDKYTYDILVSPASSVSQVLGFGVGPQNSGKLSNRGWEFTVEHRNSFGKFSYDVNANFSIINNKVMDLGVGNVKQPNGLTGNGSSLFIGYPMNIYYGYVADGLFISKEDINKYVDQTAINPNPRPGDIRYKDISGPDGKPDGKVTPAYDRIVLGSTIPKYTYGINLDLKYENFDFSMLLQGVADVKGYLNNYAGWAFYQNGNVQVWQMDGRWTAEHPDRNAKYPRMESISNTGTPNTLLSSFWILNGNYLRLRHIQLGYTIPFKLLNGAGIEILKIYASAENLFTRSHYPQGWDPEINTNGRYYPILANYTFGVNVNF